MKFSNTYHLIEHLLNESKLKEVNSYEYRGGILTTVNGNIDKSTKKHLEDRFNSLFYAEYEKFDFLRMDGDSIFTKNSTGEISLMHIIRNDAFPDEYIDSETKQRFIYGLMSELYKLLTENSLLKNIQDEDFDYEDEFLPISLSLKFTVLNRVIEKFEIEILDHQEIEDFNDDIKKDIISSLYEFINNNNDGACIFEYSDGDDIEVEFNASEESLSIYDLGKHEINIKDFFNDNIEFELN